jgi:hypothetical protein
VQGDRSTALPYTNYSPWPEADTAVYDRLGGRDSLRLWLQARDFQFCQYIYNTKDSTISILVRVASFVYLEPSGRRRRLRVTESEMGKIAMVTLDVQPVPPSLEWLVWILRPKGDMDRNQHRNTFEVARLEQVDLVSKVEKLIGLSLFPMAD